MALSHPPPHFTKRGKCTRNGFGFLSREVGLLNPFQIVRCPLRSNTQCFPHKLSSHRRPCFQGGPEQPRSVSDNSSHERQIYITHTNPLFSRVCETFSGSNPKGATHEPSEYQRGTCDDTQNPPNGSFFGVAFTNEIAYDETATNIHHHFSLLFCWGGSRGPAEPPPKSIRDRASP